MGVDFCGEWDGFIVDVFDFFCLFDDVGLEYDLVELFVYFIVGDVVELVV